MVEGPSSLHPARPRSNFYGDRGLPEIASPIARERRDNMLASLFFDRPIKAVGALANKGYHIPSVDLQFEILDEIIVDCTGHYFHRRIIVDSVAIGRRQNLNVRCLGIQRWIRIWNRIGIWEPDLMPTQTTRYQYPAIVGRFQYEGHACPLSAAYLAKLSIL